jgi:hypothetical protein
MGACIPPGRLPGVSKAAVATTLAESWRNYRLPSYVMLAVRANLIEDNDGTCAGWGFPAFSPRGR